ncbi:MULTISPECIES: carbohydrate ABC transporter permease [unclassified Frondihabitans]|uniref:carbohydrate ABC transporter permease n=1 Tax=unclassified Frondihabitans TaxID=2626248 RepID=UPI000F4D7A8A|nr:MULTISPECIES: sugar ABC transporter permease [unclassified Frondihabitans]RPE78387.1 carbohydrate ABC transporter membrane protein 1 (CUT1 family) [Frondihabitans sp. PhB153]RPF08668.1 carbohydrate ABC transporter membrane protein 1 (CUT1 family) [Frondihabitans sp. PhB161]
MTTGDTTWGVKTTPHARTPARTPRWRSRPAWLFMAPSLAILGVFVLWPIVRSFWYSLHTWTVGATDQPFIGLDNYVQLTRDPQFWGALLHTVEITAVSVLLLLVIGFFLALALASENLITRIIRSAFFFPYVVSLTAAGLVWRFLLDPNIGLVDGLSKALGWGAPAWLASTTLALPTIIFVSIWKNVGFVMIILVAGLKGVPEDQYEAARLDGASRAQLVRFVTLPALRPTILFVSVILTIQSLQLFDLVYVMTGGGPLFTTDTLVTLLFRDGFVNFQTGYASAISWVLFLLIVIVSALQLKFFRYNDVD